MARATAKPATASDCPQCGDPMVEHRAATDAEFAAFTNKENPGTLPVRVDTASPAQRTRLGPLFECRGCGYRTRVTPDGADAPRDQTSE